MKYRARPDIVDTIRKRVIFQIVIVILLVVGIGMVPAFFSDDPSRRQTALLVGGIFIVIFLFVFLRRFKIQKERFLDFVLTIDEDSIVREMPGFPTKKVRKDEIINLRKMMNGTVFIVGPTKRDIIWVPGQMENYEEMVATLEKCLKKN